MSNSLQNFEQWRQFLETEGAVFDDNGRIHHFGDLKGQASHALQEGVIIPLTGLGMLTFNGGQPDKLLQGQVTCDIRQLTEKRALFGSYCSIKGRMQSSFEAIRRSPDSIQLLMARSCIEPTAAQLSKFVPFFRTQMQDDSDHWVALGITGKETPALIKARLGGWPEQTYEWHSLDETGFIMRLPGQKPRALVMVPVTQAQAIWQQLASSIRPVGEPVWTLLEIQSGIVHVTDSLADQFLPQMLNYQALGAVNFKKGCYSGQEVVARAQFRGQVKKRLYRAQLSGQEQPDRLAEVVNQTGRKVGQIVRAAPDAHGQIQALLVLNTTAEDDELALAAAPQNSLNLLKLPYDPYSRADQAG